MATPPMLPNFSLGILWEIILPGPAASLDTQGPRMGGRVGDGGWRLKLRNAGLESELLGTHFSRPAPAPLLLGFPGELWETLDLDEVTHASRSWQAQARPMVPPLGGEPESVSCQVLAQTQQRLCPVSRAPGPG